MFRLLRLAILLAVAFVAGVLFERDRAGSACAEQDGLWQNGLCMALESPHE
ncbi:MAG: hypothetical protein AAGF79_14315 [Pseudomonadota bacterium]